MNPEARLESISGQMLTMNKKRNSTPKHDRNRGKTKMVRMAEAELPLSLESGIHLSSSHYNLIISSLKFSSAAKNKNRASMYYYEYE